jgi:hypothetical protein
MPRSEAATSPARVRVPNGASLLCKIYGALWICNVAVTIIYHVIVHPNSNHPWQYCITREGRVVANGWNHPSSMTIFVHLFISSVTQNVIIVTLGQAQWSWIHICICTFSSAMHMQIQEIKGPHGSCFGKLRMKMDAGIAQLPAYHRVL